MPATVVRMERKEVTVQEAAASAMARHDGNIARATEDLLAQLGDDLSLLWFEKILRNACAEACRATRNRERSVLWSLASLDTAPSDDRLRVAAAARLEALYGWSLGSGKLLGQATKEELEAESRTYRVQAVACESRARWMELIAEKLEPGQKVIDAISAEELGELKDQAQA